MLLATEVWFCPGSIGSDPGLNLVGDLRLPVLATLHVLRQARAVELDHQPRLADVRDSRETTLVSLAQRTQKKKVNLLALKGQKVGLGQLSCSRDACHFHSFQASFFLQPKTMGGNSDRCLKRTMVEKKGRGINP